MPTAASHRLQTLWSKYRDLIFPLVIFASILVFVVPLPAWTMDLLLSCNLTIGVILLTTIYARKPLDFSVFPALLLGTTLARLVLNVASTRLILTRGAVDGEFAAGKVIAAFQQFVAGDSAAVGLIIFVIIVVIQFLVITKGATRISEVAARFALDGMPGKQMAIDADLNAGIIAAEQAKKVRREEITQQADFYGAMDGASKFVRRCHCRDCDHVDQPGRRNLYGHGRKRHVVSIGDSNVYKTDDRRRVSQPGPGVLDRWRPVC